MLDSEALGVAMAELLAAGDKVDTDNPAVIICSPL